MDRWRSGGWWIDRWPWWLGRRFWSWQAAQTRKFARWLMRNEDPDELVRFYEDTLTKQIRLWGADGAPVTRARADLAQSLEKAGRLDEARLLREEVVSTYRRHVGPDDESTLAAEQWLALNLRNSGMYDEARALADHVLDVQLRRLGRDHKDTQFTMSLLETLEPD